MEVKQDIAASRHKSFQRIGPFALQRFSGGTDRNFDHQHLLARLYRPAQLNSCTAMSDMPTPDELFARPFFFCGIGGSGMLPLAQILKGRGCTVEGSDRSRDQGRTPEKFGALERQGFTLHPQDGSGIVSGEQILVASAAVEDTVPEVQRAKERDCLRLSRAELNSILFNTSGAGLAVAGTSGKSTVTGMLGWILHACGREPTIMNGAVMKNFVLPERPYASAVVGGQSLYVSEVDESDGSIALYRPAVGILLNVSLDHKSMEELRHLFGDYLARSRIGVINADDPEALALLPHAKEVITFGIEQEKAQIGIAVATFAVLSVLFALKAMGGGDVKLLTALALWISPALYLKLIIMMALLGGVLTLVFGGWNVMRRQKNRLTIPYGVAISAAGLWVLGTFYMPAAAMANVGQ